MKEKNLYLYISIRDNDFKFELEDVCRLLYEFFQFTDDYPENEQDLEELKPIVQNLLYQRDQLKRYKNKNYPNVPVSYFKPQMKFINSLDIPDWDNGESAYIPMFDDGEVTFR